jgi:hypothetical protein
MNVVIENKLSYLHRMRDWREREDATEIQKSELEALNWALDVLNECQPLIQAFYGL